MALRGLAESLRSKQGVKSVDRRCDIEDDGARPSVEWYVDAELAHGQAFSFRLLLFWQDGEWLIESDVRRIHASGSDTELELATRYSVDNDLEEEVASAASWLAKSVDSLGFA